jgi:hypothetical protein
MRNLIAIVFVLCIYISCKVPNAASAKNNTRIVKGTVSLSEYKLAAENLKSLLGQNLNETLYIKYEVVKDECKKYVDRIAEDMAAKIVRKEIETISNISRSYPNVTAVHLREPGTNFSRNVKWNDSIKVDKSRLIFKALFKGRYNCGSTVVVYPNKSFILVNADDDFFAMRYL